MAGMTFDATAGKVLRTDTQPMMSETAIHPRDAESVSSKRQDEKRLRTTHCVLKTVLFI